MANDDVIRPDRTVVEIVVKLGDQASIGLDVDERNEGPPCLTIEDGAVHFLLYPQGWYEIGEVRQCDLDRASDLVIDATRYRDAVYRKLNAQRAAEDAAVREDAVFQAARAAAEGMPAP
jgi:hypothetical protein